MQYGLGIATGLVEKLCPSVQRKHIAQSRQPLHVVIRLSEREQTARKVVHMKKTDNAEDMSGRGTNVVAVRGVEASDIDGEASVASCYKCGAELPNGARFCPKCGTKAMGQPGTDQVGTKVLEATKSLKRVANNVNTKKVQLAEAGISILLALMVLFAPVVELDFYFGKNMVSMLDVVINLSRFSDYLGKFAAIGPLLGVLMIVVCIAIILNAKQAFANELPAPIEIVKGVKISNTYSGAVTVYALVLLVLLGMTSSNSYGMARASGWVWLLLFGGVGCQILHFVRWSQNSLPIADSNVKVES
jgi:hypothetical protein